MRNIFWHLEKIGRARLSKHYQFRQFLHSEIGEAYGIPNVPDDPDQAIQAGRQLCNQILEPLTEVFGPLVIRSGFRCSKLNDLGNKLGLKCASNEKNYAYHIWDHRDANGHAGAAACIIIPAFNAGQTGLETWQELAWWIDENLPYHSLTFFKCENAFNIGWHENPKREIFSRIGKPRWLKRDNELGLKLK
jgi:hypothetical protein